MGLGVEIGYISVVVCERHGWGSRYRGATRPRNKVVPEKLDLRRSDFQLSKFLIQRFPLTGIGFLSFFGISSGSSIYYFDISTFHSTS